MGNKKGILSITATGRQDMVTGDHDYCDTDLGRPDMYWQIGSSGRTSLLKPNNRTPRFMAHVVTSKCSGCRFTDCVEVCPVACFYELDGQLVIHAEDCIDCTACVAECPVEAIYAEGAVPAEFQADVAFNAVEAARVKDSGKSAILVRTDPLPTAAQRKKELGY